MFGIGTQELLVILMIVLVLFGAKKLPEIGSGLGKAIRNFRRATSEPDEIDISSSGDGIKNSQGPSKKIDNDQ